MSFWRDPLLSDETRFLSVRPHPVILVKPLLLTVVSAIVLLGLSFTLGIYWLLLFSLFPAAILAWEIVARRCRVYLVTSGGVMNLEGVFRPSCSGVPLAGIANVTCRQRFPGTLLGYGCVVIDTEGGRGAIEFECVPAPERMKSMIVRLQELDALRDRGMISASEFEEKKWTLLERI